MKKVVVHFPDEVQAGSKITRVIVEPPHEPAGKGHGYIYSEDDLRAFRMERAIRELSTYIRHHQSNVLAGRLAELSATLEKIREDEAALSKLRRAALGK